MRKRRWFRPWILPLIIVTAIVVAVWYAQRQPVPVDLAVIVEGPIRSVVEDEGKTRVVERYVVSSPIEGRLQRIEIKEGDRVKKGQHLAEIDPLETRARVEQAEARIGEVRQRLAGVARKRPKPEELERARAMEERADQAHEIAEQELREAEEAWTLARREAERALRLGGGGSLSDSERDAAVTEEKLAKARLEAKKTLVDLRQIELRASRLQTTILEKSGHDVDWEEAANEKAIAGIEAELIVLRDHLQRTRVEAPASGVVLRRFEESETVLAAGAPILEIGDVTRLEAEVDYLSGDAARMEVGMPAEIFGRALADGVIPARVARIHPSAFTKISSLGVEQQRVKVIVAFDPGSSGLGDLYRVDVRVILQQRDRVTLVPESALFRHQGSWCVYRVADGIARLRTVRTSLEDGRQREVLEGLAPGDLVIVFPGTEIADGTRVTPRP